MKYQYILNGEIMYQTDDASAFFHYLMFTEGAKQAMHSTLYQLLEKSNGHTCSMVSASKQ